MKVVFLDVDGVLNYSGCKEKFGQFLGVEDECLNRLNKIVFASNPPAAIVLTSSWKELWDHNPINSTELDPMAKYLVEKLKAHGMHLTARTEEKNPMDRGMGIKAWLRKVGDVESWVVLDDEFFPDYHKYDVEPHLVKTSFGVGLTDKGVERAIEILNGK